MLRHPTPATRCDMPRHKSLADAMHAYINRPEGEPEPVKTNWSVVPANDNNPEDIAGMRVERRWSARPTIDEIMDSVVNGSTETNAAGQTVRIGKLRFSDGTQTEKAYTHGPDGKLVQFDAPMPVGAMLHTKDAQERMLGGGVEDDSNGVYVDVYGGRLPGKATRKERGERADLSKAEMRRQIDDAMAETDVRPTVFRKGFPWRPSKLRELFIGFAKSPKGESGSIAWQDISSSIVEREVWAETVAGLSNQDVAALDAAVSARTLADIAPGGSDRGARKRGKSRLMVANDNLMNAIKKAAA